MGQRNLIANAFQTNVNFFFNNYWRRVKWRSIFSSWFTSSPPLRQERENSSQHYTYTSSRGGWPFIQIGSFRLMGETRNLERIDLWFIREIKLSQIEVLLPSPLATMANKKNGTIHNRKKEKMIERWTRWMSNISIERLSIYLSIYREEDLVRFSEGTRGFHFDPVSRPSSRKSLSFASIWWYLFLSQCVPAPEYRKSYLRFFFLPSLFLRIGAAV